MNSTQDNRVEVRGVTPILRVADFDASVAYYTNALGFELEWQHGLFGAVCRGDTSIMLAQGEQGHSGTWMWIGVTDVDALFDELVKSGARIRKEPTNYPWGSRELHVFDVDGHVLRFGAEADENEPLGDWLDEDGVLWTPTGHGNWVRTTPRE